MDQTRLDAIRARCEAATPGPWIADGPGTERLDRLIDTKEDKHAI